MRINPKMLSRSMAIAGTAAVTMTMALQANSAFAAGQVTISPANPRNNETVTVSGSGFPAHKQDPTGVQIIQCSDPGGKVENLPTSASNCDGATINPLPVNTDVSGNFSTKYTIYSENGAHGASNINCNATHFCVLWVGVDYNNNFLGPHAFSTPFAVGGSQVAQSSSTNAAVIAIPIAAVVVVGALFLLRRRQLRGQDPGPRSSASEKLSV